MYADYAARLLREKWSALGRRHLRNPNPTNEELAQAFQGLADGMDQMIEELGVMLMSQTPLTQRDQLTVVRGGIQELTPPDRQWPTAPIASSGVSPQSCTHCLANTTPSALLLTLSGTIVNGTCDSCLDLLGIPFVLDQDPDLPCLYSYTGTTTCGTLILSIQMEADSISGTITIAGVPEAQLSFTATAPYNGSTERTTSTSDISVVSCDLTNVTATIEGASASSTSGGITNENIDLYYSLFRSLNWGARYDCETKTIVGGLSAIFKGPVMMDQIICPDGSCLDCSEVANTQASLTPVTRVGDIRIVQNDDGNYVLQKHAYTDLVAAQIEDLGWQDSYEFPSIEALVETVEYDSAGRAITQTQIGNVFVVGAGDSATSTVHAATLVSRFVKNVDYDIFSHLLTEAYATNVYVWDVGPTAVDIIDPAEPCSGAGVEPSLGIGEAELTAGAATLSAEASHAVNPDTGTAAMTVGAATLNAAATHDPREYEGTAALTVGAATLSAEATFAE